MKKTPYLSSLLLLIGSLMACTPTGKSAYAVTIDNHSSHAICSVKFYPSGPYHLHADNLLKESLFKTKKIPAHRTTVVDVPEGVYDIRIKTCNGLVWGHDVFKVPEETSWSVNDEQLFVPVR